jgi:hypothetical protein
MGSQKPVGSAGKLRNLPHPELICWAKNSRQLERMVWEIAAIDLAL